MTICILHMVYSQRNTVNSVAIRVVEQKSFISNSPINPDKKRQTAIIRITLNVPSPNQCSFFICLHLIWPSELCVVRHLPVWTIIGQISQH